MASIIINLRIRFLICCRLRTHLIQSILEGFSFSVSFWKFSILMKKVTQQKMLSLISTTFHLLYFFENHSSLPTFPNGVHFDFLLAAIFLSFFAIVYPSLWHHNRLRLMIMFACKCCLILVFSKSTFINRHTKESL